MVQATLAGAGPIQVGAPLPAELDLTRADPAALIPADPRDPAQVEAVRVAWMAQLEPLRNAGAVRLCLPDHGPRIPLLLAASQALKAADPGCRLFVAFQPGQAPIWDEAAWGALDGGALLPADLGADPQAWRIWLAKAQAQMPGRTWTLWLAQDPGAQAGVLLGDGGRLVVPGGGATARLARVLPDAACDIEGGLGDLIFSPRVAGAPQRWRFEGSEWLRWPLPRDRTEVVVAAQDRYDLGALLARVRATQLRNRAALRTLEGTLQVDLHLQRLSGPGQDLGYRYDLFCKAGEGDELVRREVLMNGVRANLDARATLPIVEASVSVALPVALAPSERFRYADAGPGQPGQRRIRFEPVDADPTLPRGELLVAEASGQILRERSHRDSLPGKVRTVDLTLEYREVLPGLFRVAQATGFERWITASGMVQVQRRLAYSDLRANAEGFELRRDAARGSSAFMLKQTVDGVRYFERKDDGSRVLNQKPRTATRAMVEGIALTPGLGVPLFPIAGRMGTDDNLGERGIQFSYVTLILINLAHLTIPHVVADLDLNLDGFNTFLPLPVMPVQQGQVLRHDQVNDYYGTLNVGLSRDLGAGFRGQVEARFRADAYAVRGALLGESLMSYATPGFQPPPGGLSREARGQLLWQKAGVQVAGYYGAGHRPAGDYGLAEAPQPVAADGQFRRWGLSAGYDLALAGKSMLHLEAGDLGGTGVDRFKPLDVRDLGNATIVGFSPFVFTCEHANYQKLAYVLPPRRDLRLTVGLEQAQIRALDDQRRYALTALALTGDLPGFWKFTSTRIDLGAGLRSTLAGARTVTGSVMFLRVF